MNSLFFLSAVLCLVASPAFTATITSTCSANGIDLYGQAWSQSQNCGGEFPGYAFAAGPGGISFNPLNPPDVDPRELWQANNSYAQAQTTVRAEGSRSVTPSASGFMEYHLIATLDSNSHNLGDADTYHLGALHDTVFFFADGQPVDLSLIDNYGPITGSQWSEVWVYRALAPVTVLTPTTHSWYWEQAASLRMDSHADKFLSFSMGFEMDGEPRIHTPEPSTFAPLGLLAIFMVWRRWGRG